MREQQQAAGAAEGVVVSDDDRKKLELLAAVPRLRLDDGLLRDVRRQPLEYIRRLVPYAIVEAQPRDRRQQLGLSGNTERRRRGELVRQGFGGSRSLPKTVPGP